MDTGADHYLDIKCSENLSGNRFLNIQVGDATRTVSIAGDVNLNDWFNQSVKTTASPLFDHLGLGGVAVDADIGINFDEVMTDVDNSVKASIYSILQVTKIMAADMVSIAYGVNMLCTLDSTNTQNWTNVAGLRGIQGYIITEAGSAGTVTGAACLITSATIADAATVTNLYGLYISTPAVAGNKVTNEYGIYIANQNTGQTLNYAIYTNTGLVHFGDDITVVGDITANHLGLGGAAVDADIGINFSEVLTDVDNSVKAGVYSYLQVAKTTAVMTAQGIGVSIECNLDSSNTQNWTNAIGLIGLASIIVSEAGSAGTITGAAALTTYANFADAATITNYYGLYTSGASVAGNKLTNLYGIYIADQNTGLTLNYAIYTNAGVVRFGDIVFINETANTRMTTGLTINQGAADDEILALKSSDVAHGITTYAETDTYGSFVKQGSDEGGVRLTGYTEVTVATNLWGVYTTDNTDKTAAATGACLIEAGKKSGTGIGNVAADANILVVKTYKGGGWAAIMIVDEDGDIYYDGAAPASFDKFEDTVICHDLANHLCDLRNPAKNGFKDFIQYNKDALVKMGVVSEGGFVSTKSLNMLLLGAISQLGQKTRELEKKLNLLES